MGLFDKLRDRIDNGDTPIVSQWHEKRATEKFTDELIGICRGILMDGSVVKEEAVGLLKWLEHHQSATTNWPGNAIHARVIDALRDNTLSDSEERDLIELLSKVTGNSHSGLFGSAPSELPWDKDARIEHFGRRFVLTGDFVRGPRHQIEQLIKTAGGIVTAAVSAKTDFVIVGLRGSDAWKHSGYGTKIEKAMTLKQAGEAIRIIPENEWLAAYESDDGVSVTV